jgi:hypothetical protein
MGLAENDGRTVLPETPVPYTGQTVSTLRARPSTGAFFFSATTLRLPPRKMQIASMTLERAAILERMADDDEVMFFEPEGLDCAIVGLSLHQPSRHQCVVYSYGRMLEYFIAQGMTHEDAEEWMSFNVLGVWIGEHTPIIIDQP